MLGSSDSFFSKFKTGLSATNNVVIGRQKDRTLEDQLKSYGEDLHHEGNRVNLIYMDKEGNQMSLK